MLGPFGPTSHGDRRVARSLDHMSVGELQAEISRRQRSLGKFERQRSRLLAKLSGLDRRIAMLGGSSGGRRGRAGGQRPRNEMTLVEALGKVLSGKTMSVTDAAEAVRRVGYRTNSSNFRTQVNIALIKSGAFKRTGRGQYTAK
jgi:hypothetical protein